MSLSATTSRISAVHSHRCKNDCTTINLVLHINDRVVEGGCAEAASSNRIGIIHIGIVVLLGQISFFLLHDRSTVVIIIPSNMKMATIQTSKCAQFNSPLNKPERLPAQIMHISVASKNLAFGDENDVDCSGTNSKSSYHRPCGRNVAHDGRNQRPIATRETPSRCGDHSKYSSVVD